MTHPFVGTTLALSHYYDIVSAKQKRMLMTAYQALEQPFGQLKTVWMAEEEVPMALAAHVRARLDRALLANRGIEDPCVLRILDYGTGDGHGFVVTDPPTGLTLREHIRAFGPLELWQVLRLLEQLVGIVTSAHRSGFSYLALTSESIFVSNVERMQIAVGPLGIGLRRSELLALEGVPITIALVEHIPPWEFRRSQTKAQSENDSPEVQELLPLASDLLGDDVDEDSEHLLGVLETDDEARAKQADHYAVAAIIYEALSGVHPYFGEGREIPDAVLTMMQARPLSLSDRCELGELISDVVMQGLLEPNAETLTPFLAAFAESCDAQTRDKARNAEKLYLSVPKAERQRRIRRRPKVAIKHPLRIFVVVAVLVLAVAVLVTWQIAGQRRPVDLFALPEIMPSAQGGIDVVVTSSRGSVGKQSLYLTSMADGSLIHLGQLPFIYRSQAEGTRLGFVIVNEQGRAKQEHILVQSKSDVMHIEVSND